MLGQVCIASVGVGAAAGQTDSPLVNVNAGALRRTPPHKAAAACCDIGPSGRGEGAAGGSLHRLGLRRSAVVGHRAQGAIGACAHPSEEWSEAYECGNLIQLHAMKTSTQDSAVKVEVSQITHMRQTHLELQLIGV